MKNKMIWAGQDAKGTYWLDHPNCNCEAYVKVSDVQAVKDANKDLTIALKEMECQFSGWAHDETQSKALEQARETLRRYK